MQRPTPPLALEIIERELKERTGSLILSDCGITEIPHEVFEMDWLTELVITNGYFYPENKTQKTKSTKDYSEPNHLTYIPEQIAQLKSLKKLHLGPSGTSPWTITGVEILSALQELEELNLSNNQITDIVPLQYLVKLKSLNLSQNEIRDIDVLDQLTQLENLELFNNQIEQIFALEKLTKLETLALESNQISSIEPLIQLTKLNILLLSNNQIANIDALISLVLMQELYLNNNQIPYIDSLHNMTRLRILNISDNNIPYIDQLDKITGLQELYFNNNQVADIYPLENLAILKNLHCNMNQIVDIAPLSKLSNLRELFIEQNQINFIEPIIQLRKLDSLKLNENPISDCPSDIWGTNDIGQIRAFFEGQTRDASTKQEQIAQKEQVEELVQIQETLKQELEQKQQIKPEELEVKEQKNIKKVKEEIKQKLEKTTKELEKQQQKQQEINDLGISDVKLIFVGNSGAGKTQLSKYFESGKLDKTRESTHGIRLKRWLPDGRISPALTCLKDKIAANIWDFGGQEYYHGTFRLFLSNYAVYVLLWEKDTNRNATLDTEVRDGEEENLQHYHYKYWLDNIRHYAPTSPIIILQNKVDKDERDRVDTEWIKEYEIFGDHYISLHEAAAGKAQNYKWTFDLFCNDLSDCLQSILSDEANQQKSIAWLKVRDAVVNVTRTGKGKEKNPFVPFLQTGKYISTEDFEKACLKIEPKLTESELYTLPRWLHNSGVVIYFSEHKELSDKVYLDPSWVTKGIYEILNETVRAKEGVFTKDDMKQRKGFRKDTVLALMEEMEIVFERNSETDKVPTFVAPQYLPENHPVEDLYAIAAKGLQQKAFFIRLPLYFFRKVLQRMIFYYGMSEGVDARYYWKKGILFEKGGTRVMFKGILPKPKDKLFKGDESETESRYGVFLIGAEPVNDYIEIQKEVFHIISEILEEKELSKIAEPASSKKEEKKYYSKPMDWTAQFDDSIENAPRWLRHMEVSVDGDNFVDYLDLCKKNRSGLVFIQSQKNQRLRIHDFEVLLDNKPQQPLKVFFSYSHKDTEFMNRLSVHLASLRRNEKIEVWTDKAIQAGDEWDTEIQNNLKNSNIILFLISADFIASSYIWENEIKLALELRKQSKAKVIPIYLRPFDFDGLNFTDLEMLPKDDNEQLKAISQWDNIDAAFKKVATEIREVIDSFN